ncbi:MAG: hypothetical protein M3Q29_12725 [Chloroflexota bacterium]|nr:hypothetical protein [Chloroflexota bacterium]
MRRIVPTTLIPLLALVFLTLPTRAELIWCKTDPVVTLNGTVVDIQVDIPLDYVLLVNGPTSIEIQTPKSVARELILSGPGFNGYGEEVFFTDGGGVVKDNQIPTTITVQVPIDESQLSADEVVPVRVTVIPENALPVVAEGTSELTKVQLSVTGQ